MPYGLKQLILAHHPVAMPDQVKNEIEDLRSTSVVSTGYGADGTRVDREEEMETAIDRMLDAMRAKSGPFLIDLVLART